VRSILLSNIPHYHHLAEALHGASILDRYITSNALVGDQTPPRWMPRFWSRKLEGRRIHGVPSSAVLKITLPESLQRILPRLRLISPERGDWLNNHLFDSFAKRRIEPCDIFHFVSSVGLYCAQKAKQLGATIICDVRQEHPAFQRRILEEESRRFGLKAEVTGSSYERKVLEELELADFIIVPSSHAKRTYLAEGFAPESLLVLPYGVELTDFHPPETSPSSFRVIYAGSLTLRKGPQYLLEAFAGGIPGVELVLAGSIDPAFKPLLARCEGAFTYSGVLPRLDLQKLYATGAVFVLPSLADSFSLATLEAMACGLPVIISENTGAADVVENGRHGFVVPIRDAVSIREKIIFMRDNRRARIEMSAAAAERAQTMSWTRYGSAAVELYQRIYSARGSSTSLNSEVAAS
jgi:glycosyltransferase involved in cell wall biosynthesis